MVYSELEMYANNQVRNLIFYKHVPNFSYFIMYHSFENTQMFSFSETFLYV